MRSLLALLIKKAPDSLFVQLKNLQGIFKGASERYLSINGKIQVSDGELSWTTHRHRCHLYSGGFTHRGRSIGKSYLLSNIAFNNRDVVIDCGANMGDLQLYFWDLGSDITYIGIEPNPIDFECLSENKLGSVSLLNLALWNEKSSLRFWVDSKSASSSLIEPPSFTEIITVDAVRLDQLALPPKIKLLKIEGEGAEPEILFGCSGILHKVEFISADVGPERGVDQTSTRNDVIDYLVKNNFEIVEENPHHRKTILFKNKTQID
jgi:FkbM family methyltransferase